MTNKLKKIREEIKIKRKKKFNNFGIYRLIISNRGLINRIKHLQTENQQIMQNKCVFRSIEFDVKLILLFV